MNRERKIRAKMSIRKGDLVRVMSGRDRDQMAGKSSRVLSVNPVKLTVTVEHAHMIKRHTKANPSKNVKGGIVEKEAAIHISNVMLVCPGCNRPTRVGHAEHMEGNRRVRTRVCRRCGVTIEKKGEK
jgi:large subunit ribosomal protein L24